MRAYYLGLWELPALGDVQQGGLWACGSGWRRKRCEDDGKAFPTADAQLPRGEAALVFMCRYSERKWVGVVVAFKINSTSEDLPSKPTCVFAFTGRKLADFDIKRQKTKSRVKIQEGR